MTIQRYVAENTLRGECQCGQCIDKGSAPDPTIHTVDLCLFKVGLRPEIPEPKREDFERLTREFKGEFAPCDPFDGKEHGFIELGAWIGDQGLAMQYMGLGVILGAFKLLSPVTVLELDPTRKEDRDFALSMAQAGFLTVQKAA